MINDATIPEYNHNEVLIKIKKFAGEVVAKGDGVTSVDIGDRVSGRDILYVVNVVIVERASAIFVEKL